MTEPVTPPALLAEVDAFWASRYGVEPDALVTPGVHVGFHEPAWYRGVMVLSRGEAVLVSVPEDEEELADAFLTAAADDLRVPEGAAAIVGGRAARTVGPAWVGYLTDDPAIEAADAHRIDPSWLGKLDTLVLACDPAESEHASIDLEHPIAMGIDIKGDLVAAASVELWGGRIADIGLLVHPARRRSRYGSELCGSLCRTVRERGWLPQYRSLVDNDGSMGVARAVGFSLYGTTTSVRLA